MNNNEYISSDYENNNHHIEEDDNSNLKQKQSQAWGTWEELLLACAVKRHGFGDWDSIAKEVRSRTTLPALIASANNCKQKYRDLKRRFQESGDGGGKSETVVPTEMEEEEGGGEEEEEVGNIPWLEQLRSLRVAELRREVQQYDVSILSLQLKVKKLEEEREQKPDLEDETKRDQSTNNDSEPTRSNREKSISPEESDRENRSINESNSTGSVVKTEERIGGDEPNQARDNSGNNSNKPDPDPVNKAATEDVSVSRGSEASHSGELGESGTSGGLGKRWRRKGGKHSSSKVNNGGDGGEIRSAASKSQPLINLLEQIRSHPRGSFFERRLRSQDTKDYKNLVKEHLDINTIHRKLEQGSYDSSRLTLYRDLQLLFTNAITFFPSSSPESMAAHELRSLIFNEMRKETGKSSPNLLHREALVRLRATDATNSTKADAETSDSSLSRQKSSATLVVCKRRNSASTPSSSSLSQKEETREEISEEKENIVTGVRSSRRSTKVVPPANNNTKTSKAKNKQKQTESKTNSSEDNSNKPEPPKPEKKIVSSEKKKSVADFLKRIEKNSPKKEDQNKNSKKETKSKPRELRSNTVSKKKAEVVETTPLKRTAGRPQKKTAESSSPAAAATTTLGKRGRETGSSTGKDNKQPKKRSRR